MDQISVELLKIYNAQLYIGFANNLILGIALVKLALNSKFAPYGYYQRTCLFSALAFLVFGLGYLLHAVYEPRLISPMMANALNISYYHIGGVLFALSHTTLMNPAYLTKRRVFWNLLLVCLGLFAYWYPLWDTLTPAPVWKWAYLIFLLHASVLALLFYRAFSHKRKVDTEAAKGSLRVLRNAIPRSSHLIVVLGIGCAILFNIFPDVLILYTLLMVVSYFVFYYVYRALFMYGNSVVASESVEGEYAGRRRLFRYNSFYHFIVLVVSSVVFYMYGDIEEAKVYIDKSAPRLNLTKKALWDTPALDDYELEKLDEIVFATRDSAYYRRMKESNEDTTGYATSVKILNEVKQMPDESPYKGYITLQCLNNVMVTTPREINSPERMHAYIEEGYKIASGNHKIAQSLFFTFWNNAMISYSDMAESDSIYKEAMRLMKVCRQQKHPLGIMEAHTALAYCFMDSYDFLGAAEHLREAIQIADKYYPSVLGKDWKQKDGNSSDFIAEYLQVKSLEVYCRYSAEDTIWIKNNINNILEQIKLCDDVSVTANFYFTLAQYYDKTGDDKMYESLMGKFRDLLVKFGCFETNGESSLELALLGKYYQNVVSHEIEQKHGKKAMQIVEEHPEIFNDSTLTYRPEVMLLNGRYEEAARQYKVTVDYYKMLLNGRNRRMLRTLSSGVDDENRQMQKMENEIEKQKTRLMYNSLLLFILAVMIAGLTYFLLRQRRLNKDLHEAMMAAEKANNAKDIFLKNMTHELHTPMNAIYGFAQLLADRDMPLDEETTRMMADNIVEGSEQLTRVLDNIIEVTDKLAELDTLEEVETVLNAPSNSPKGEG